MPSLIASNMKKSLNLQNENLRVSCTCSFFCSLFLVLKLVFKSIKNKSKSMDFLKQKELTIDL